MYAGYCIGQGVIFTIYNDGSRGCGVFVGDDWPEHRVDPDTNMRGSHYDDRVLWRVVPGSVYSIIGCSAVYYVCCRVDIVYIVNIY